MTIYRPTVAQEMGGDHSINKARFRHTLATEMMKSPDRNLAMVKSLLGHRSVSTTMEYIELDLKITGQALESELALYMDIPRIPASGPGVS